MQELNSNQINQSNQAGFGAILEKDQLRHPIASASRQTNDGEKKYGPTQLEVVALNFGAKHFEVYLLGNKVTIFTDHQALVSAFLTHLKGQAKELLARWYLRLSRFLPSIYTNGAADALLRSLIDHEVANVYYR